MAEKNRDLALLSNRSMPESYVIPELAYRNVNDAVRWLVEAFGFEERLRIGNHRSQLTFEQGAIIVTQLAAGPETASTSGMQVPGARNHSVMVRVKDVNRHYERAVQYGTRILNPLADYPYGERQYTAEDLGGHVWTFSQTIADVNPECWGGNLGPAPN